MFIRTLALAAVLTTMGLSVSRQVEAVHPYRANVSGISARLNLTARNFHNQIRNRAGFSHLEQDAVRLAQTTEQFARLARTTSDVRILSYHFEQVSLEVDYVCREVEYALLFRRDAAVARTWDRLEQEFDQIYHALYGGLSHRPHGVTYSRPTGRVSAGTSTSHPFANNPVRLRYQVERPATLPRHSTSNMFLK